MAFGLLIQMAGILQFCCIKAFTNPKIAEMFEFFGLFEAQNLFSRNSLMNFVSLAMPLGTNRVAKKCQTGLKVPVFTQKLENILK